MGRNISSNELLGYFPGGTALLESWAPNIQAVNTALGKELEVDHQIVLATCLENTQQQIQRVEALFETTQPTDIGPFKKYALDLVTAVIPNLIALDIFSVQPLLSRVGEIRYIKYLYGSNKGKTKAGTEIASAFQLGANDPNYSSETIDEEFLGDSGETEYEGNLSYVPVRPGTIEFKVGGSIFRDNGNGVIAGNGLTSGTIDYLKGSYTLIFAQATTEDLYVGYECRLDYAPVNVPQIDIKMEVSPIIAKPRKLRTLFAFDSAFDLQKDYGTDINSALVSQVATELKHEIDGELMNDALAVASASDSPLQWSSSPGTGVSITEHNMSFWNKAIECSNAIFSATKRAAMTWMVVGVGVSNIVETLPNFKSSGAVNPIGPHLVGYLGSIPVYKNPYYPADYWVAGYKGVGLFDAGIVYAPYMPIVTTTMLMDDTFVGRRGYATSYGKKTVNSKLYCTGKVV